MWAPHLYLFRTLRLSFLCYLNLKAVRTQQHLWFDPDTEGHDRNTSKIKKKSFSLITSLILVYSCTCVCVMLMHHQSALVHEAGVQSVVHDCGVWFVSLCVVQFTPNQSTVWSNLVYPAYYLVVLYAVKKAPIPWDTTKEIKIMQWSYLVEA